MIPVLLAVLFVAHSAHAMKRYNAKAIEKRFTGQEARIELSMESGKITEAQAAQLRIQQENARRLAERAQRTVKRLIDR